MMRSVLVLWGYLRSLRTKCELNSKSGADIEVLSNDVFPAAEQLSREVGNTRRIPA